MSASTPSLSADGLDFSSLNVGSSMTWSVIVSAPSDADCTMTVSSSGSGFSVSPTGTRTVSAGTVLVIEVTFSPTAEQSYSGTLTIDWTCGDESGQLTVSLSGTGIDTDEAIGTGESTDGDDSTSDSEQRATLMVPSNLCIVNLGKALTSTITGSDDTGTYSFDFVTQSGFSAMTTAHVFMRAAGSSTFQADGQVWFQSGASSLDIVAGGNAYMIAGKDVYLGAADYLGIMAGHDGGPLNDSSDYSAATPGSAAPTSGTDDTFFWTNVAWESFGIGCNGVTLVNTFMTKKFLNKLGKKKTWLTLYIPALLSLGGLAGTISAWTSGGSYKATFLFAEAGILAATPGFINIHSGMRVSYRSLNATVLGLISVQLSALLSARLVTVFGEVSVRSATALTALSAGKVNVYSTLQNLELFGTKMSFGGVDAGQLRRPTTELNVSALNEITIRATSPAGTVDTRAATSLEVGGLMSGAEFTSLDSLTIDAGGLFEITASASGVSFKQGGLEVLKLASGLVTLGPAAGQIKMTPALTDIGGGAMKMTPAGIMILAQVDLL